MLDRKYQSLPEVSSSNHPLRSHPGEQLSQTLTSDPPASTTWYITHVEGHIVCKELSSAFTHLSLTKGPEADRPGVVLI